ncbi:MAG TPA: hypothetical protein VJ978_05025 [Nitriliruptoraceae bacterium]|nr:hypothetical protein [Nitriliruptoraceae bacterium]
MATGASDGATEEVAAGAGDEVGSDVGEADSVAASLVGEGSTEGDAAGVGDAAGDGAV